MKTQRIIKLYVNKSNNNVKKIDSRNYGWAIIDVNTWTCRRIAKSREVSVYRKIKSIVHKKLNGLYIK